MKLADWAWSKTDHPGNNALWLALLLVGLPILLVTLVMIFRALDAPIPLPVASVERWIEQLPDAKYDTAGFNALYRQQPDFTRAHWETITLPDTIPIPPISDTVHTRIARVWMRMHYELPANEPPPVQLAVHVTRIMGGAWSVWLNGKLLEANLEDWRMQWNVPLYVKLPPGTVTPGQSVVIDVAFPYRVSQGYAFGSMYIGQSADIQRIQATRSFWQNTMPKAAILITLLLGGLALHHWYGDRSDRAYLMLALCAFIWFLANTQYFGDFLDNATSLWFSAMNDAATSALLCTFTLFSIQFDGERWPRLEIGLIAYSVVVAIITLPVWNWGVYGLTFQHYIDLVLIFGLFGFFTWRSFARGSYEFRVVMLATWTMPIMGLHNIYFLTAQRAPDGIHLFPYSTFIMFGAFFYVMQRRYHQTRVALVELNASLDSRLRAREAELQEQHRKLMNIEQEKTVQQERQRLMRDMHDGIGTSLMTSLSLAEHGKLTQEHTATLLRESLDELKLVIDSLEPIGKDISTLLASLRFRFGRRIEDAGIHIVWDMEQTLPPLPWLEPTSALQVLRIVQEALSNILKHASATKIHISARTVSCDTGQPGIIVCVSDNGSGFDTENVRPGRGLDNLRRRAADLGAELQIRSGQEGGTTISLYLPIVGAEGKQG